MCEPFFSASSASSFTSVAPLRAISIISSRDILKVTLRCNADVLLYKCTIAFLQPLSASKVLRIKCSRLCVSTCNDTSSGTKPSSIIFLMNLYSVSLAAGKPTSISLKPISMSVLNSLSFWSIFIGTASAWLPSRKSTLHHTGAESIFLSGHCRFGNFTSKRRLYFNILLFFIFVLFFKLSTL